MSCFPIPIDIGRLAMLQKTGWLSKMGIQLFATQEMSLFHGTSALSACFVGTEGFYVHQTSSHGGKEGLFGQSRLMDALLYAKWDPRDGVELESLTWENCPVVLEYRVDPNQEYYDELGVHRGKRLQHYNQKAILREQMWVWRHHIGGTIYGFGDGVVDEPVNDPIGISHIYLRVPKAIFCRFLYMDW